MEQQQSFHPSEISLLVLRYLAGIECTATAKCFFTELPGLREFLQSKNRGYESPRAFEGPEVLGSLEDILCDYGKAKMMVKKLIKLMNEWKVLSEDDISPCDTLGTQLKQVSALLSNIFSQPRFSGNSFLELSPPNSTQSVETQTSDFAAVIKTKRIASTCTTLDTPERQNMMVAKIMQAEEVQTHVTIPTYMEDRHGIRVEKFIKSLSARTEKPEIHISPMLQQLMAPSQKRQVSNAGSTKTHFNTPHKKTHVRNLVFTTPPSCSAFVKPKSNCSEVNSNKVIRDSAQTAPGKRKRKSDQISSDAQKKCPTSALKSKKTNGNKQVDKSAAMSKPSASRQQKPHSATTSSKKTSSANRYFATIENVIQFSQNGTSGNNLRNNDMKKDNRHEALPLEVSKSTQPESVFLPLPPMQDETARPLPPLPPSLPDSSILQSTSFSQASHSRNFSYSFSQKFSPQLTPVKITAAEELSMDKPLTPGKYFMNFGNSWDSTDGKITLHFENNGIYPTNLLLSSPLKLKADGLPITPGRCSAKQDEDAQGWSGYSQTYSDLVVFKDQHQSPVEEVTTTVPSNYTYTKIGNS